MEGGISPIILNIGKVGGIISSTFENDHCTNNGLFGLLFDRCVEWGAAKCALLCGQ